ncbi:hypothetical protein [Pleionea sp. CnH1-48]|uniref:hypothetical protein n=1 Tax=Pleionea sp. CnH1-48 TaxID=2954494 RepID=UPI0020984B0B|nr:hypothetical protein [Pleionea sp. CnH1-48]MCO7226802.1 hypothetical protein [Pleionea sp. CnH1-48]
MSDDFNWDDAVNEWQHHTPDLPALKRTMRWETWRMKLIIVMDFIALLALIPAMAYLFSGEHTTSFKVFFVFLSIWAVIGAYFDLRLRQGLWQQDGSSTRHMLEFALKRANAGVHIARFTVIYIAIFMMALIGWVAYLSVYEMAILSQEERWFALVVSLVVSAGVLVGGILFGRKKKQEAEQLTGMLRQYQES